MTFAQIFQGNEHHRGITSNGKYPHYLEKNKPFNHEEHLKGIRSQGLSPLRQKTNEDEAYCILGGLDFDFEKIPPSIEFCKFIYDISPELFVFESRANGYHVYWFANDWIKAAKMKTAIERLKKKINPKYKVDRIIPYETKLKDIKIQCGFWFNAPYFANTRRCLNHLGEPLTLKQFELKYKLRKHHYLAALVGWKAAKKGTGLKGRHQVLWTAALYQKYRMEGQEDILRKLNESFNPPITDKNELDHAFDIEGYDEEHLNNNLENYFEEIGIENKIEEPPENLWESTEEFEDLNFNTNTDQGQTELVGYDMKEYRTLNIPPKKFIIGNMLFDKSFNFIVGPKGTGKSEFVIGMCVAMTRGHSFLGREIPYCYPVVYIDAEMYPTDPIDREKPYLERWGEAPDNYFHMLNFSFQDKQQFPDLKSDHMQKLIKDYLKKVEKLTGKKPLLVLDNLRSLSSYKENDSDDWFPIGKFLFKLRGSGFPTIIVDHMGKMSPGPRGSSSKTDWADLVLILTPEREKGSKNIKVKIAFDKARGLRPENTDEFFAEYNFHGEWTVVQGKGELDQEEEILKVHKIIEEWQEERNKLYPNGPGTPDYEFKEKYPNGNKLPTQKYLADKFGCSTGKMNKLMKAWDKWIETNETSPF